MNELTANMKTEEAIKEKIRESRFESINGKDLMEMGFATAPLHHQHHFAAWLLYPRRWC